MYWTLSRTVPFLLIFRFPRRALMLLKLVALLLSLLVRGSFGGPAVWESILERIDYCGWSRKGDRGEGRG